MVEPTQTAAGSLSEQRVMLSKQVMVRNVRRGQTFCLIPVTHPACEPRLVLGPSLGRKCYYKETNRATRIMSSPKP